MTLEADKRQAAYMAAARTLIPLQQGRLDGLCGLYAIVNALRLVLPRTRPLTQSEAEAVFGCGVNVLETHGQLAWATIWGVRHSIWKRLVAAMSREVAQITCVTVQPRWPLRGSSSTSRTQLFAVIETAIERHQPVLVSVAGTLNHYTVICGYGLTRLRLFDSNGHQWLGRGSCGLLPGLCRYRHLIDWRSLTIMELV